MPEYVGKNFETNVFRNLLKDWSEVADYHCEFLASYFEAMFRTEQVGWVFKKKVPYEDRPKEKYTREVWVSVSATEPKKVCSLENLTVPRF